MDEEQLSMVEEGLNQLIKKYRKNNSQKDAHRLKVAIDAKNAIRKVMLYTAVQGDIQTIKPVRDERNPKRIGWEIIDYSGKVRQIFSET